MRPATRTLGRLAALATAVVGFAVAPATAGATPEALDCTVSPRPAPICGVESTVPIAPGRPDCRNRRASNTGRSRRRRHRPPRSGSRGRVHIRTGAVRGSHACGALVATGRSTDRARGRGRLRATRRGDLAITSDADAGREARPAPLAFPVATPHGFDWTDAAVGAAVALGAAFCSRRVGGSQARPTGNARNRSRGHGFRSVRRPGFRAARPGRHGAA